MRDFTQKEKELIVNTPITKDCFDLNYEDKKSFPTFLQFAENARRACKREYIKKVVITIFVCLSVYFLIHTMW